MDITCPRGPLVNAMKAAAKIAKPVAGAAPGASLDVTDNTLLVTAADIGTTMRAVIEGEGKKPGRCTVDAGRFARAVGSLGGDKVRLRLKSDGLEVSAGLAQLVLPTLAGDFSAPGIPEAKPFLTGDAAELTAWIGGAAYAACQDETRANVNGVLIERHDGRLLAVATDGHRLAMSRLDRADVPDIKICLAEIETLVALGLCSGEVILSRAESTPKHGQRLVVVNGGIQFSVALYDADGFAPWQQVMPKVNANMRLNTAEFKAAVERALIVSDRKSDALETIKLELTQQHMIVSNQSALGATSSKVGGEWDGKQPFTVGMNASYLAQALAHAKSETIVLGCVEGGKDDGFNPLLVGDEAVCMPVRL